MRLFDLGPSFYIKLVDPRSKDLSQVDVNIGRFASDE